MLETMLRQRNLPELKSAEDMLNIMLSEVYGTLPPKPDKISWTSQSVLDNFCAGKATLDKVSIECSIGGRDFSFPVYVTLPTSEGTYPFFVHINFRDNVPDRYMPTEEIIDNGFAILSFCYNDVTKDNDDFTDGLAGVLYPDGERGDTDPGKIAMWAWAAQRVMDYALTLDCLDKDCAIVCGHSRLGKTALLAGATDSRFAFVHSNDSGCSGAAITRQKEGERIRDICSLAPYWFCKNYYKYIDNEDSMPFDQHYLVGSIAPRCVYIASAQTDTWADPVSEMLTCVAVSPVYEAYGKKGLVCENRTPTVGDVFHDGCVGYHLRKGTHYFGREDWLRLMEFVKKHSC